MNFCRVCITNSSIVNIKTKNKNYHPPPISGSFGSFNVIDEKNYLKDLLNNDDRCLLALHRGMDSRLNNSRRKAKSSPKKVAAVTISGNTTIR